MHFISSSLFLFYFFMSPAFSSPLPDDENNPLIINRVYQPDSPKKRTSSDYKDDRHLPLAKKTKTIPLDSIPLNRTKVKPQNYFDKFEKIASKPVPVTLPKPMLEEELEGSRRWVKFLQIEENGNFYKESDVHQWHRDMALALNALNTINQTKELLPRTTNMAVARLTVVLRKGNPEIIPLPYFFVSGWPANKNKNSAQEFSKKLAEGTLDDNLKEFKGYGLRFIAETYCNGKQEDTAYRKDGFLKEEIHSILKKEADHPDQIIRENRIQEHLDFLGENKEKFSHFYFHSEQSIWPVAKETINNYINNGKAKNNTPNDCILENGKMANIAHAFLDICSFYDMCRICGDVGASYAQTNQFGINVYMRVSGCKGYIDMPYQGNKYGYSLREKRHEFTSYKDSKAFDVSLPYKPYIAHSMKEDWR